jgi:glycosyltransferase involved in cell wall biosynthesis
MSAPPSFTFITPTFRRPAAVLKRCLDSVEGQAYANWRQIVVVDDATVEPHIPADLLATYTSPQREFVALGRASNNSGNSPRQFAIERATTDFVVFLDDDNVIFPNYLEVMAAALIVEPTADMAICRIIHMGPLPPWLCPPPKVLDGNPPVLQNIDSLQAVVRTRAMKEHTWLDRGYMADGYTLQSLAAKYRHIHVSEILGVHM